MVTLLGVVQLAIGIPLLPLAQAASSSLPEWLDVGAPGDGSLGTDVPAGTPVAIAVVLARVTVLATALALLGAVMTLVGLADLVTGRTTVEGRVLRRRDRSDDNRVIWYLAVDDGTTDRVRAWRFHTHVPGRQGDTVRGVVSQRLRHVADLEIVKTTSATSLAGTDAPTAATTASTATAPSPAATAPASSAAASAATAALAGSDRTGARVAPPSLPDGAAVSAAAGRTLTRYLGSPAHPAALAGGSAIYRAGDGHIQVVWVPAVAIDVYRGLPAGLRHEVPGLGDEGYRRPVRRGVMARSGDDVVMVTPHLPGIDTGERDGIAVRVARTAIDHLAPGARHGAGEVGVDAPHDR
jgi:hypothetical protein